MLKTSSREQNSSASFNITRGTTTVEVTATNNTGTATCSFTVTVKDFQAPVISNAGSYPAILTKADKELKNVCIDYTATDNCWGVISGYHCNTPFLSFRRAAAASGPDKYLRGDRRNLCRAEGNK